jgi:coenzyme PQQ precursor peptide PqqA
MRPPRREVTAMDRESSVPRIDGPDWETPAFEEIRVSAEATAYMGVKEDWD